MLIKRLLLFLVSAVIIFTFIPGSEAFIAQGASNLARWQIANIPKQGAEQGWFLADGSDVTCLAQDDSGILYAGVSDSKSNLYKSVDGGNNWQKIEGNADAPINTILIYNNTVYSTTNTQIYKITDNANVAVAFLPSHFTEPGTVITSIDISFYNGGTAILVGTKNENSGKFGGVYLISGNPFTQWQDLGLAGCDVYSVAFSPRFSEDNTVIALAANETQTFVTRKEGSADWSAAVSNIVFKDKNTGNPIPKFESAKIVFPKNRRLDFFDDTYLFYAALNTGSDSGGVYSGYSSRNPEYSLIEDLNIGGSNGIDISSLDILECGDSEYIIAGSAATDNIYTSFDGGISWKQSQKSPGGEKVTSVLFSADYKNDGKAYCTTAGNESAFSISIDNGRNWNQYKFIDAKIDNIVDVAVSDGLGSNQTLFLLTEGNGYSIWRTGDDCRSWRRVFVGSSDITIDKIDVSPEYGNAKQVLYFYGSRGGTPTLWNSENSGNGFSELPMPFEADCWQIINDDSFFIAGFDGSNALLYRTVDGGAHYKYKTIINSQALTSIALSPDYANDKTMLVGNCNGEVYFSTDEGITFLPPGNILSPLSGDVSIAFSAAFQENKTVYAAGSAVNNGIFEFVIGESTVWEAVDDSLPAGAMITDLKISQSGVLYAVNQQQVASGSVPKGGIERSLCAADPFETFVRGLEINTTLTDLKLCGSALWSIDTTHNSLLFFKDTLSEQVNLTSPANRAIVKGNASWGKIKDVLLDWETLEGAGSYNWQVSKNAGFSSIIGEGTTTAGSVLTDLSETDGVYYWRVRAVTPLLSPWSKTQLFSLQALIPLTTPQLKTPAPGAVNVPLSALFQWDKVNSASGYELEISAENDFQNPFICIRGSDSLPINAWQNSAEFEYNRTYYWHVRAVNEDTIGDWSAVGVFATIDKEDSQTTVTADTSQPQITQTVTVEKVTTALVTEFGTVTVTQTEQVTIPIGQEDSIPDWFYYAFRFMAIVIVLLLAAILVIVMKRG